jgi:hypothetical protein
MPRAITYSVRVRQHGEPWRLLWTGEGEQIACDAAWALARETRAITGTLSIPVHPYIRVSQSKRVILDITPERREQVA